MRCILDYETRSKLDLKATGAISYAMHESTSIFCLAFKIDGEPTKLWIPEITPIPADLWEAFQFATLVGHNASFERAITAYCLTRYGSLTDKQRKYLSLLSPSRWVCTAAKAAACSLPRKLEVAGAVLGLPVQKDKTGHKLMLKYCKPRRPSKLNPNEWWDDKTELKRLYEYCMQDVETEYLLDQALPDLTAEEQKVWELDQKINDRGVLIDVLTVKLILEMIKEEQTETTKRVQILSNDSIMAATQRDKVLKWLIFQGADLENLRADTVREKLAENNLDPAVKLMLELRQAASKTSTAKYIKMTKAVCTDNRARELLLYHGTIPTGRWSGKRIQPQNFPRPTIEGFNSNHAIGIIKREGLSGIRNQYGNTKVMGVLASSIRGMLIPSPGKEFFCADFSAVEARLAFWVAGHEESIQAFKDGKPLYEEMAAETFDMEVKDITKDSLERFVGKALILGAQYGLGPAKFLKTCHQQGMTQVTDEIARKAVYTYRKLHWPIPQLWSYLEKAAIEVVLKPSAKKCLHHVQFYVSGNFLCIRLPSGRRLRYYKPTIKQKQLAGGRMVPEIRYWGIKKHKWQECSIWGGIFTNHIVQGIARDLMVNGIMNIENAGYETVLTVHDEVLAERKRGKGDLREYISLMTKLPKWADGAPIRAEGWTGLRYRK